MFDRQALTQCYCEKLLVLDTTSSIPTRLCHVMRFTTVRPRVCLPAAPSSLESHAKMEPEKEAEAAAEPSWVSTAAKVGAVAHSPSAMSNFSRVRMRNAAVMSRIAAPVSTPLARRLASCSTSPLPTSSRRSPSAQISPDLCPRGRDDRSRPATETCARVSLLERHKRRLERLDSIAITESAPWSIVAKYTSRASVF